MRPAPLGLRALGPVALRNEPMVLASLAILTSRRIEPIPHATPPGRRPLRPSKSVTSVTCLVRGGAARLLAQLLRLHGAGRMATSRLIRTPGQRGLSKGARL